MGCGFAEVGTVTPRPQKANSGVIVDRSIEDQALWNKMGFPSNGLEDFYFNLRDFKHHSQFPVFSNIGKNRTTPNSEASLDYIELMQRLTEVSDLFVLNISSPNTKGLRELAQPDYLNDFLNPIINFNKKLSKPKPLLLKLSPDLSEEELIIILNTACEIGIDGFVLTNTTLSRSTSKQFPSEGGVSGLPLKTLSLTALTIAANYLKTKGYTQGQNKKLLISVGGVMTAHDVFERIKLGADLVQVYSALTFSGPSFFRNVAEHALAAETNTHKEENGK